MHLLVVSPGALAEPSPVAADSLQDIEPGQWEYAALRKLVESYQTDSPELLRAFDRSRALSRYEFALGLNQALEKMNARIAEGKTVPAGEVQTAERLYGQYRGMLTSMEGQVQALEARIAALQANLFSPIVKLSGAVYAGISAGTTARDLTATPLNRSGAFEDEYDPTNLEYGVEDGSTAARAGRGSSTAVALRTDLKLSASFTGRDILELVLRGNGGSTVSNTYGAGRVFNFAGSNTDLSFEPGNPTPGVNAVAFIDELYYNFPVGPGNLRIFVGPRLEPREIFNRSAVADLNAVTFLRHSFQSNPLLFLPKSDEKGSGVVADWFLSDLLSLRTAYIAFKAGQNRAEGGPFQGGLLGGDNQLLVEAEFRPTDNLTVELLYNRASRDGGFGARGIVFDEDPASVPNLLTGGLPGVADALLLNFDWQFSEAVSFNGRYGYGLVSNSGLPGSALINAWSAAFVFNQVFGREGDRIGFAVGQPLHIHASGAGLLADTGSQTNFELFYNLALGDRFTLKPDFQLITQPGNVFSNSPLTVGSIVGIFRF